MQIDGKFLKPHPATALWRTRREQCAQGQRTTQFCGMVEQARLEEREACAKVCEQFGYAHHHGVITDQISAAIRARGQQEPEDENPSF